MEHIYNLSAIKKKMTDVPKAQRLQRLMNEDNFDTLSESQCKELIRLLKKEALSTIKFIKDNVPYKL